MQQRELGALLVSVVGIGCNNFGARLDQSATSDVVNSALDAGINFFDTADIYGATKSEEFLGVALAGRRADAVVATALNGAFVPKRLRAETPLREGDRIEIVAPRQGG